MWKGPSTIQEAFERNLEAFPDREALYAVNYQSGLWERLTWRQVKAVVDRLAGGLAELGVQKGQKLAFMNASYLENVCFYLAARKVGTIFIPVNVRLVSREVEYIVINSDTEILVYGQEYESLVEQMRPKVPQLKTIICIEKAGHELPDWAVGYSRLLKSSGPPPQVDIYPEDEADIIYTSGTTGRPKGVVLTEAGKLACGRLHGNAWGFHRLHYGTMRHQTPFPFFTSTGVSSHIMTWLWYGYYLIWEPVFDALQSMRLIAQEKTSSICLAPTMIIFIMQHPQFKEFDMSSLRIMSYGGSAMPEEVIRQALAAWPGLKLVNIYGLTEGGVGGTRLGPEDHLAKLGSIGLPWAPDMEGRIVNDQDQDMGVKEVGELIFRGPNVMKEYYKNPEATAETLKNGWLHTGDLTYYDEEGYIYYVDRKKDMLVRGGYNVYSVEVESVLYEHPAVKQCCVVGKPHPKLGEDVAAFVVLREGQTTTAEELMEFCRDKLADFKRPRDIRFLESLPVTAMGKLDKKEIRARYFGK
jgi:acyl-CoA synthetase (AMP-forming)/AMP-acid ligase II